MNKTIKTSLTSLIIIASLLLTTVSFGQGDNKKAEITGVLNVRFNNCFCPNEKGPDLTYFVYDKTTQKQTELDTSKIDVRRFHKNKKVKVKGFFKKHPVHAKGKVFEASSITVTGAAAEGDTSSSTTSTTSKSEEPETANAAPAMTNLSVLMVFANSNDYTIDENRLATVVDMMFDADGNNGKSAKLAMEAMTNGHYTLSHGATARVTLNMNTTGLESGYVKSEMEKAVIAAGYNLADYQRYMYFCPNGVIDSGWTNPAGWTAYANSYDGTSVWSYSWTGTFFDALLHELGHNFGLHHAGIPPYDSWDDPYKDRTCVMGFSHSSTASPRYTATYSGIKKYQNGWLTNWGSQTEATQDVTYDIYPISTSPESTPGMRVVKVDDPADTSDFYVSYRRLNNPYGWLRYSGDADKVYIQEGILGWSVSWRKAAMTSGTTTVGDAQVIFERYGPNNEYVTVSFDFPDGNTKPVANNQSVSTEMNYPVNITLSGSDADGNNLEYAIANQPTNGSLSALSGQNVTYTPNTNFTGSDSFIFKVHDGNISSFATVSITVTEANQPPVADNQSVSVFYNTPESITLTGSDANGDELSYQIVSNPGSGTLSAIAGNKVTYTPNTNFSGNDSFTFRAYDGKAYSAAATVTLNVLTTSNTPPTVFAGVDKVATLSGEGPWTPAQITTTLWLDASDTTTLSTSGSAVSQWNDKSGNENHLAQTNTGLQPASGATINGLNAVDFTGDKMSSSSNPFGANIDDAYLILVHKIDQIANGTVFSLSGTTTTAQRWQSHAPWGDGNIYFDANGRTSGSYSVSPGDVVLSGFYNSVTDSSRIIYKNGAVLASTSSANQVLTAGAIWLGGISSSYQDTTIGEVLVINGTVTTEDRQKMEGYLAHKWGLSTNLPADHPYKQSAPGVTGVTVQLDDATVTDPEHTPSTVWTLVSGPAGAPVTFGNSAAVNTSATFTQTGTYVLRLTADDGYDQRFDDVTIIVGNGPEVLISQTGGSTDLAEGGATDTYTIALATPPSADVTVTLTPDEDVTISTNSITFTNADWNVPREITVTAVDDSFDEGTHTGTITHSATSTDSNYNDIVIGDLVASISDNDDPGTIALASANYSVNENAGTVTLTVKRNGGTAGAASVEYTTSNGSATAGSDYVTKSGTLNWAAGESANKTITININDDSTPEADETFNVSLSNITGAYAGSPLNATVSIADDEKPGTIAFASASYSVDESGGSVTLTVNRTGGSDGNVSVDYATSNRSATAGSDYVAKNGTLSWTAGDSSAKTITITINEDSDPENDEIFDVILSNVSVASLGSITQAGVTIIDNDFSPNQIASLVGWYDAQTLSGNEGSNVNTWADKTGGTNTLANDLGQASSATLKPTLRTIALNNGSFRSVRFVPGATDAVELLTAAGLTANGDYNRTIIMVYKGGANDASSAPVSFGSITNGDRSNQKNQWTPATDGNGSMRFGGNGGGISITGYSAGLNRSDVLIRSAVMESATSFDEYIDVLDTNFTDKQVLSNGVPSSGLGSTSGDFYIGDATPGSQGGGAGATTFDVLEVLVYDKVLTNTERQQVQDYLKTKYTVPSVNEAPVITLDSPSTNSVTIPDGPGLFIETTVTDDGNPVAGTLSASWSKVSGPGTATFASPASDDTTVTFTASGEYLLRLTADDGDLQTSLDITVNVGGTAANVGPFVSATDSMGTTALKINLQSTISDDGNPGPLSIQWTKINGPGNAALTDANSANASAIFDTAGTYTMRVMANDGSIKTFDDATVTVNDPETSNIAPVASDDSYGADAGFSLVVSKPGVLSNDEDFDGDTLTAIKVSDPANGSLVLNADGSFTYTPNPGFKGKDSFTYKCFDGMDESNVATVSIRISGGSNKKR